ncbi:hypothetical protein LCGC14_1420980 [marine sediment metagenome]|uniref:Uncharacterized protein n=1 Tax=marine sediment metagenome TaxID=412755 RepID=A0A0F9JRW3_9ZZZZ
MITYEFECEVHGRFEVVYAFGDLPLSAPCPVMLYEGDEGDDGTIQPETEVLCNEDSVRVLSPPSAVFIKGPKRSGYHSTKER